jgi:hypothetical protein
MNHLTVAVASKAKHYAWWQALRPAGVPIISTWIDWPFGIPGTPEPKALDWQARWERNISDAGAIPDILLVLDLPGENQCGSLIELGAALSAQAHGKQIQVFLVSENWWSVEHHRNVRKFRRLEDAIAAIMAMRHGTELRLKELGEAA